MDERAIPPISPFTGVQSLRGSKVQGGHRTLHRSSAEVLKGAPAQMLLSRLDSATIVIGFDGVVVYANPACERLLGYQCARTLEGRSLPVLLAGHSDTPPTDCIELLRDPNTVTNWNHSDGYPLAAVVSDPLLFRTTGPDPMLLVSLRDVSDRVWTEVDRAIRYSQQRCD